MEKKGKILIIDDNEDILFGLNMLLKPLVDEVRVATRPDQLLRFYQMIQPDVVLMDMNFSYGRTDGREGFDMLHEVLKLDPDDRQDIVDLMDSKLRRDKYQDIKSKGDINITA